MPRLALCRPPTAWCRPVHRLVQSVVPPDAVRVPRQVQFVRTARNSTSHRRVGLVGGGLLALGSVHLLAKVASWAHFFMLASELGAVYSQK